MSCPPKRVPNEYQLMLLNSLLWVLTLGLMPAIICQSLSNSPSLTFSETMFIDSIMLDPKGLFFISSMCTMALTTRKVTQEMPKVVDMKWKPVTPDKQQEANCQPPGPCPDLSILRDLGLVALGSSCISCHMCVTQVQFWFHMGQVHMGSKGDTLLSCMSPTKVNVDLHSDVGHGPSQSQVKLIPSDRPTYHSAIHGVLPSLFVC